MSAAATADEPRPEPPAGAQPPAQTPVPDAEAGGGVPPSTAQLGRSSAIMAAGTVVSRLLGFAKAVLLAAAVGVTGSVAADAFGLANSLPNSIYVLIAGGALNAILVPQLVRAGVHRAAERGSDGAAYVNRLLTLAMALLLLITVLAALAAPALVVLFAGTSLDAYPGAFALAVGFAYWCLPQIFFYGLYTLLGEVLNARNHFGPFMWAPVLNNIVAIAGLAVFLAVWGPMLGATHAATQWSGLQIAVLAGSATVGVAAQALVLFVFWRRAGLRYRPDFRFRGVGLRSVGRAAGWTFAMLLVMQLGGVVSTQVLFTATGQAASLAATQTAWLVFMLPHSIAAVSITTAYFTRMSAHASTGERDALRGDVSSAARMIGLVNVLATAALMITALPFSRVFEDDAGRAAQLAEVLLAYLPGLIGFSLLFVVQRAFFAQEDTRTPFLLTAGYIVVFSAGTLACLALPKPLLAVGIAAVTSAANTGHAFAAAWLLSRRIGPLGGGAILRAHLRFVLAAVPAAAAGFGLLLAFGGLDPAGFALGSRFSAIAAMAAIGAAMLAVYLVVLRLLRAPELAELAGGLRRG